MLELTDVSVSYGLIRAVRDVSIRVEDGEIVALLGPNGAGKTTLLSAIVGLRPSTAGSIIFNGEDLAGRSPDRILRSGISLVPEGRRVFAGLTVAENLRLGAATRNRRGTDGTALRREEEELLQLFPVLRSRYRSSAELLSGGEQQQLAIARALMSGPRLLLLDEPSLGLAPKLVDDIYDLMAALRRRGTTLLVVEQHAHKAAELADRVYIMNTGELEFSGLAEDLEETELMHAYLGT